MAIKTYGSIEYELDKNRFVISRAEPHVCIKLKHIFQKIKYTAVAPFYFNNTPENCADLSWFIDRYPMEMKYGVSDIIDIGKGIFERNINELEAIHLPDYIPVSVTLKPGESARHYQLTAKDMYLKVGRMLLAVSW